MQILTFRSKITRDRNRYFRRDGRVIKRLHKVEFFAYEIFEKFV